MPKIIKIYFLFTTTATLIFFFVIIFSFSGPLAGQIYNWNSLQYSKVVRYQNKSSPTL